MIASGKYKEFFTNNSCLDSKSKWGRTLSFNGPSSISNDYRTFVIVAFHALFLVLFNSFFSPFVPLLRVRTTTISPSKKQETWPSIHSHPTYQETLNSRKKRRRHDLPQKHSKIQYVQPQINPLNSLSYSKRKCSPITLNAHPIPF